MLVDGPWRGIAVGGNWSQALKNGSITRADFIAPRKERAAAMGKRILLSRLGIPGLSKNVSI